MPKIIIASKNPVKINAALDGFVRMFPEDTFEVSGISVSSQVKDQPDSDKETRQGAINRANNAATTVPDADYYVGLEGGIEQTARGMMAFAWAAVRSKHDRSGSGRTSAFYLPPKVAELVRAGKELGEADDIVFSRSNSKQQNGAVGILTNDAITRTSYYAEAVVLALIPFKHQDLY